MVITCGIDLHTLVNEAVLQQSDGLLITQAKENLAAPVTAVLQPSTAEGSSEPEPSGRASSGQPEDHACQGVTGIPAVVTKRARLDN